MTDFSKQLEYLLALVSAADHSVHSTVSATRILTQIHNTLIHLSASHLSSSSGPDSRAEAKDSEVSGDSLKYLK